jgi:uncharacterized SAM-binding protein YcdF (DUF218 family)
MDTYNCIDSQKFLYISILVIGCLCILGATATTIAFGFTVGNAIAFIAGLFLIGLYFIYPKLQGCLRRWIKVVLLCGMTFMIAMMLFIGIKGTKNTATFNEDAILVLGCGIRGETPLPTMQQRLDKCLDYLQYNPGALIVVSGGQGHNEAISEAEAMKRYLIVKGVNAAHIITEDQSRNTLQNMQFSKQILDNHLSTEYSVVCITSNYHAYRAAILAAKQGLNATSYNAGTTWYLYPSAFSREILSICKMRVMH